MCLKELATQMYLPDYILAHRQQVIQQKMKLAQFLWHSHQSFKNVILFAITPDWRFFSIIVLRWTSHVLIVATCWCLNCITSCKLQVQFCKYDTWQTSKLLPPPRLSERQLKEAGRRLYSFCHCLAVQILPPEAWQGLVKYTSWQIISLPQLDAVLSRSTLGTHAHFSIADKHALPESRYNKTFISAGGQTCDTSSSGKYAPCSTSPRSEVLVSGVRQTVTCLSTPARTVLTLSH